MQGSDTVSPCDREPCKGDQIAYEQARAAAAAAVQATQNTLKAEPTAAVVGLSLLGAALAGAGGLIVWTGIGTAPGAGLIAAGGASGGGAIKLYKDWKDETGQETRRLCDGAGRLYYRQGQADERLSHRMLAAAVPGHQLPVTANSSICKKQLVLLTEPSP